MDPLCGLLSAGCTYVSHETIYRAIYGMPRGAQRRELVALLRQSRSGRRRRSRGKQRFVGLQGFTPIALRPKEIDLRQQPRHWEGRSRRGRPAALPLP